MGFKDKFKAVFGFDKDEEDQEIYEYDVKDLEETNVIKPSFFSRKREEIKDTFNMNEDVSDENSYKFENDIKSKDKEAVQANRYFDRFESRKTTVTADIRIVSPISFEDATGIIDSIKDRKAVVLNTTKLELKTAQRLLDFVSGAVYALKGEIKEIMEGVYVISPENIRISDDVAATGFKSMFNFK